MAKMQTMSDPSGYFKPGERKAIYNACQTLRDKVLIRVLWKSGRRVSEVLHLRVKDINFVGAEILWHIEKKYKTIKKGTPEQTTKKIDLRRVKPIDDFTLRLLNAYIQQEGLKAQDYIFYGFNKDKPISRQRAYQIVDRSCKRAGVLFVGENKPHPHHFRHTFAVNWVQNSTNPGDIVKLKDWLEHSDLSVTQAYLQFATEESRELLEMDED